MLSQRAREITARDFAAVAASSSSIPKQHFPQLLERHLLRQPTGSELAIMTTLFGESGLQLDSWLQCMLVDSTILFGDIKIRPASAAFPMFPQVLAADIGPKKRSEFSSCGNQAAYLTENISG